ncbi:hypothetical protein AB836_01610 [Rickettsiales bacterium (ex Bugula neritina AB1)]|nr:hypothetical protein AB836_01610 [Rickettsiales bacterium (ex Bugula neritina AB1)]
MDNKIKKYIYLLLIWLIQLSFKLIFLKHIYNLSINCNIIKCLTTIMIFILLDIIYTQMMLKYLNNNQIQISNLYMWIKEERFLFLSVLILLYLFYQNKSLFIYSCIFILCIGLLNKKYAYIIYIIYIITHFTLELLMYKNLSITFINDINNLRILHLIFWWQMYIVNFILKLNK